MREEIMYAVPSHLAQLLRMLDAKEITRQQAKEVFSYMLRTGFAPADIAEALNLVVFDAAITEGLIEFTMMDNQRLVDSFREGNAKAFDALMGIIMKFGAGSVHPDTAKEMLTNKLKAE